LPKAISRRGFCWLLCPIRASGQDGLNYGATETAVAVIDNGVLTWRHGALGLVENDARGAVGLGLEPAWLVCLAVAHLCCASERLHAWRACEPVHRSSGERFTREQRVIVSLHCDEHVALGVFGGYVPWLFGMAATATDLQAAALAQRVKREALVRAHSLAVGRLDRTWSLVEELAEELPERPLANEADSRAVGLVEDRKSSAACTLSD
jgi:hypothetical protein